MKISWAPWVFLPLRGAGRCLTELKMQLQKQIFLTNPCGFLGRMESSRLGLWCLSTSLQSQESRGMKTGRRWEWRLSCPFPNEKQLPACKQQKVWGKTKCWYHIKLENFYISCRIWIVYFSLLVLQIYNKLRIKHTFFFFFSWPLPLFPTMSGFPSKLPSANLKNMLPTSGREKGIQREMPSRAWRNSQREKARESKGACVCVGCALPEQQEEIGAARSADCGSRRVPRCWMKLSVAFKVLHKSHCWQYLLHLSGSPVGYFLRKIRVNNNNNNKTLLLKNLYVSFSRIKRPRLRFFSNFALSARKLRAKSTAQTEPW